MLTNTENILVGNSLEAHDAQHYGLCSPNVDRKKANQAKFISRNRFSGRMVWSKMFFVDLLNKKSSC